ncbi:Transcription factor lepE [Aspergillus parasiticus]
MDGSSRPLPQTAQRKRRRPVLACDRCRRRKIRCDRKVPCSQCLRTGYASTCTYLTNSNSSFPGEDLPGLDTTDHAMDMTTSNPIHDDRVPTHNGLGHSPPAQVEPIPSEGEMYGDFWDPLFVIHNSNSTRKHRDPAGTPASPGHVPRHTQAQAPTEVQVLIQRVRQLEQKVFSQQEPENSVSAPHIQQRHPQARRTVCQANLLGRSHWLVGFAQFDTIVHTLNNRLQDDDVEFRALFFKCQRLSRAIQQQYSLRASSLQALDGSLPSQEACNVCVNAYCRSFESVLRILHVPTFRQEYNDMWTGSQPTSKLFMLKLQLVIAIGARVVNQSDMLGTPDMASRCVAWIQEAQQWLHAPGESLQASVDGIQLYCLVLLTQIVCAVDASLVYVSTGALLQKAQQLGLHRDPSHFPAMPVLQAEIRRRLWCTVCELVLQSSMDSGTPPLISCDEFDCRPPANLNDTNLDTTSEPEPSNILTQTSFSILLMRCLPIRVQVAKVLNSVQLDPTYSEVLRLGEELTAACHHNTQIIKSMSPDHEQPTLFQLELLNLLTYRFLLCLHQPFAMKARKNLAYYFSRRVCLETAIQILAGHPTTPSGQNVNDYLNVKRYSSGLFRDPYLLASVTMGHEILCVTEGDWFSCQPVSPLTNNLSPTLNKSQQGPRTVLEEYVGLSECRLKDGAQIDIKTYVLLSCIIAQIKAAETRSPQDDAVLSAAVDSLERCHTILVDRYKSLAQSRESPQPLQVYGGSNVPCRLGKGPNDILDISETGEGEGWSDFDVSQAEWSLQVEYPDLDWNLLNTWSACVPGSDSEGS